MLIDSLKRCLDSARKKEWTNVFVAVDIHDTIVRGNYKTDELPTDFLFRAKETLQLLSKHPNVTLIMYTCSHPVEIEKYYNFFENNDIDFKYCNENPDVPDNALGCYRDKLYFNILLDDKAGFNGETEWPIVYDFFKNDFKL